MKALYLCYLPSSEPLVETQVMPYLVGLAAGGHRIRLVTFEDDNAPSERVRRSLEASGIEWSRLRYHKRPSLPATAYDTLRGAVFVVRTVRREEIDVVHVRNHVPGAMALMARPFARTSLIFDVRGLMAEEYVDGGLWRRGSLPWRLTKWVERVLVDRADGIVVLTRRAIPLLLEGVHDAHDQVIEVIPTCVDVAAFERQSAARSEIRGKLGYGDARVLAYAGKFSTWYQGKEMARFFRVATENDPDWRFLVLTQSDPTLISGYLAAEGLRSDLFHVRRVEPAEVGAWLSAADAAISFIAPAPSKAASSPTKIAEYLAAGLPIVIGSGVGDTDELVERHRVGVVVGGHTDVDYRHALAQLDVLLSDQGTRDACRQAAKNQFSLDDVGVPAYRRLYASVEARRRRTR